jgi:hypothetical protein
MTRAWFVLFVLAGFTRKQDLHFPGDSHRSEGTDAVPQDV